jgi:hypothetical protein
MSTQGSMLDVLAQTDNLQYRKQMFDAMHHRFVSGEPQVLQGVLAAIVTLALLLGSIWLLYRWQKRWNRPAPTQPMTFFRRVTGKLGLSMLDRWWLWRLARSSGLEHPTAMLISSRLYDSVVERYCAGQGVFLSRAGSAVSFTAIRRKLFSGERA